MCDKMTVSNKGHASKCPCHEKIHKSEGFHKVIELEESGMIIFCHIIPSYNVKTSQDVVVVHKTRNKNPIDILQQIDKNDITCLRCRQILKQTQELLNKITGDENRDLIGICTHCRKKGLNQQSCIDCENVIQNFLSLCSKQKRDSKQYIKMWVDKHNRRKRSYSDIDLDLFKSGKSEDDLLHSKMLTEETVKKQRYPIDKKVKLKEVQEIKKLLRADRLDQTIKSYSSRTDAYDTRDHYSVKEKDIVITKQAKASKQPRQEVLSDSQITMPRKEYKISKQSQLTKQTGVKISKQPRKPAISDSKSTKPKEEKIKQSKKPLSSESKIHKDINTFFPSKSQPALRKSKGQICTADVIRHTREKLSETEKERKMKLKVEGTKKQHLETDKNMKIPKEQKSIEQEEKVVQSKEKIKDELPREEDKLNKKGQNVFSDLGASKKKQNRSKDRSNSKKKDDSKKKKNAFKDKDASKKKEDLYKDKESFNKKENVSKDKESSKKKEDVKKRSKDASKKKEDVSEDKESSNKKEYVFKDEDASQMKEDVSNDKESSKKKEDMFKDKDASQKKEDVFNDKESPKKKEDVFKDKDASKKREDLSKDKDTFKKKEDVFEDKDASKKKETESKDRDSSKKHQDMLKVIYTPRKKEDAFKEQDSSKKQEDTIKDPKKEQDMSKDELKQISKIIKSYKHSNFKLPKDPAELLSILLKLKQYEVLNAERVKGCGDSKITRLLTRNTDEAFAISSISELPAIDVEELENLINCKARDLCAIIKGDDLFVYRPLFAQQEQNAGDHENQTLLFQPQCIDHTKKVTTKIKEQSNTTISQELNEGVIHYALSDRTFIEKGWTMLPIKKIMRKMNVYRMYPAQPESDWFKRHKDKGVMEYNTGEVFAVIEENGRGRWYYKNGNLALDYYNTEELNAQQRFVVYSSGEPDERGRCHPITILATFDYLGNGIVFDHAGKTRLKYNQTEGNVLDRSIGPVSHWKWHTLNDPPVLQQVMIDTQLQYKDETILQMADPTDRKPPSANEEMLSIEHRNAVKKKTEKITQKYKPFPIKMKALKINKHFSLKVLDQATIYLIFRDGSTNLKINIGMNLYHHEIIDTEYVDEVQDVSSNFEWFPARSKSLEGLRCCIAYAQLYERTRTEREHKIRPIMPYASADQLVAATSRPVRIPLKTVPSSPGDTPCNGFCECCTKR